MKALDGIREREAAVHEPYALHLACVFSQRDVPRLLGMVEKVHHAATVAVNGRLNSGSLWDQGYQAFATRVLALLDDGDHGNQVPPA